MNKTIVDLFYELDDDVFANIVSSRLPNSLDIELINRKLCENPKNAYVDVAFVFKDMALPREAFYTHIYYYELNEAIQ